MKKLIAALGLAAGALFTAPASAGIALTYTTSSTHIGVGDLVTIDVGITGLGAELLSAFDTNFVYDPAVLTWMMMSTQPALDQLGGPGGNVLGGISFPIVDGNLGADATSLMSDADLAAVQTPDTFLLFRFALSGVADGTTFFTLGSDPYFERLFVGRNAAMLDVDVGGVCIGVGRGQCTVPEPSSFGLVAAALLALGAPALSRRASKR